MKIALITDTHWGARSDCSHFHDYFEDFYTKQFFPELEKRNIDTIIHLGDIVDRRKYINYVTLRKMKDIFIDVCDKKDINLHVIVGNHDVPFKNTNEVNSMNLLLREYDNFNIYQSEPKELTFGSCRVMMLPWISKDNAQICLDAINGTL